MAGYFIVLYCIILCHREVMARWQCNLLHCIVLYCGVERLWPIGFVLGSSELLVVSTTIVLVYCFTFQNMYNYILQYSVIYYSQQIRSMKSVQQINWKTSCPALILYTIYELKVQTFVHKK